jgi:hypothetical protein
LLGFLTGFEKILNRLLWGLFQNVWESEFNIDVTLIGKQEHEMVEMA